MFRLLSVLGVAVLLCARPSAAEFSSYAVVRKDASLLIRNQVVRLFGIYIPQNGQFCNVNPRPPFCGTRTAAALDFKIQGFVTCQETGITYSDGSISAVCWMNNEDLSAYLISAGLALAGPDAPFEYQALERIAQTTNQGVWGFQASISRNPAIISRNPATLRSFGIRPAVPGPQTLPSAPSPPTLAPRPAAPLVAPPVAPPVVTTPVAPRVVAAPPPVSSIPAPPTPGR